MSINPVDCVFGTDDLRKEILKHNHENNVKQLVKKIYPKWKYNARSDEFYIKGKPGRSAEPDTQAVRWSLVRMKNGKVDTGRLLITDLTVGKGEEKMCKFDGIVNTEILDLKKQPWYVPKKDLRLFLIQGRDDELDQYYYTMNIFLHNEYIKRMECMDQEMIRRNENVNYILYKIPEEREN